MRRTIRLSIILCAYCLLQGCSSLSLRVAGYSPPPIADDLLQECQEPEPVKADSPDGGLSFRGVYLMALGDQEPWRACRSSKAELVRAVKYRDKVQTDVRNLVQSSSKSWYEFWK